MTFHDITISGDEDDQRLDRIIKRLRPDWPYVLTQKLLRKGSVKLDGKKTTGDKRVKAGQVLRLPLIASDTGAPVTPKSPYLAGVPPLDILFEDNELLVINKPSGLAVQGGSGLKIHLEMLLEPFARHGVTPRLVHRIDRETSGVLVVARTMRAARRLTEQFTERKIEKIYHAVTRPIPNPGSGVVNAPLRKVSKGKNIEQIMVDEEGDEAETRYKVLAHKGDLALVECRPHTGRTHQIRVHLSHIGAPLVGDSKYGGDEEVLVAHKIKPRVMLHAVSISFEHPRSGEAMYFTAPFPDDFARLAAIVTGDKK